MSHVASVLSAYTRKFGPFPTGGQGFFPASPLKFAVIHRVVPDFVLALQEAIDSGTPLDFNAWVQQVQWYEARDSRCLWPEEPETDSGPKKGPKLQLAPTPLDRRAIIYPELKLEWD